MESTLLCCQILVRKGAWSSDRLGQLGAYRRGNRLRGDCRGCNIFPIENEEKTTQESEAIISPPSYG